MESGDEWGIRLISLIMVSIIDSWSCMSRSIEWGDVTVGIEVSIDEIKDGDFVGTRDDVLIFDSCSFKLHPNEWDNVLTFGIDLSIDGVKDGDCVRISDGGWMETSVVMLTIFLNGMEDIFVFLWI